MSWISGPCNDEPERDGPVLGPDGGIYYEPERNVTPSDDDEESGSWAGASHFHPYLVNQREYPRRRTSAEGA